MSTLPLSQPELSDEIKDKIRTQSRQRYAMDRGKLEELIKIWSNKTFSPVEKAMQKAMEDAENQPAPAVDNSSSIPDADDMERRKQEQAKSAAQVAPKPPVSTPPPQVVKPQPVAPITKQVVTSPAPVTAPKPPVPTPPPAQPVAQTSGFDTNMQINEVGVPIVAKTAFTINDVKVGEWYDGFVKLKYNYGLFVTVK